MGKSLKQPPLMRNRDRDYHKDAEGGREVIGDYSVIFDPSSNKFIVTTGYRYGVSVEAASALCASFNAKLIGEPGTMVQCIECKKDFFLSASEGTWYESRGFLQPRRCPGCRKTRRDERRMGDSLNV